MWGVPASRVLRVHDSDASGNDLVQRLERLLRLANADVDTVSDCDSALGRVEGGLDENRPYALIMVPSPERANEFWRRDPLVHVAVCRGAGESIRVRQADRAQWPDGPESADSRLHFFEISPCLEADDSTLSAILARASLRRSVCELHQLTADNWSANNGSADGPAGFDRLTAVGQRIASAQSAFESIRRAASHDHHGVGLAPLYDSLTRLPNRALLEQRMAEELGRVAADPDYRFAVLLMNINRFRVINDSFGHDHGDALLVAVGRRLRACVRTLDMVCRVGADEFAMVLGDTRAFPNVHVVALRCLEAATKLVEAEARAVKIGASIGAVTEHGADQSPSDVLRSASLALVRAKAQRRPSVVYYRAERHVDDLIQYSLEADLLRGIERQEFYLEYQPIVRLDTGDIAGFEALVRWRHPHRGVVPPGLFISLAEENGLIEPLGGWILDRACADLLYFEGCRPDLPLSMALNVSRRQLSNPAFADDVARIVESAAVSHRKLTLEITETLMLERVETVAKNIDRLRRMGAEISIDDFGTGYSSLHALNHLSVDSLKIDRSFVQAMGSTAKGEALVRTIVDMGHVLDLPLIAEGIEKASELECLVAMGCDFGQGYFFSRPVGRDVAARLLREGLGAKVWLRQSDELEGGRV